MSITMSDSQETLPLQLVGGRDNLFETIAKLISEISAEQRPRVDVYLKTRKIESIECLAKKIKDHAWLTRPESRAIVGLTGVLGKELHELMPIDDSDIEKNREDICGMMAIQKSGPVAADTGSSSFDAVCAMGLFVRIQAIQDLSR